jgi:hypothetical protein
MKLLQFKADRFLRDLQQASEDLNMSLSAAAESGDRNSPQLLMAMHRSIDIMQRLEADRQSKSTEPLAGDEVSQIGGYVLSLLDELVAKAASRGLKQSIRALQRLSIPVAQWIAEHGGRISTLDIVVNAYAGYANEIRQQDKLQQISDSIEIVVHAVADDIRQDLESGNSFYPWRVLNLNWGIVATRSHDLKTMQRVFDQLIENIPYDVRGFFREGMQQMEVIAYPEHVRAMMEKYNRLVGNAESLH